MKAFCGAPRARGMGFTDAGPTWRLCGMVATHAPGMHSLRT